jgi:hypothetical protein
MAKATRVGVVVDTRDVQLTLSHDEATALLTMLDLHVDTYGAHSNSGVMHLRTIGNALGLSSVGLKFNTTDFGFKGTIQNLTTR